MTTHFFRCHQRSGSSRPIRTTIKQSGERIQQLRVENDMAEGCLKNVIVISEFLKSYSKAKRTRAPAYSRALSSSIMKTKNNLFSKWSIKQDSYSLLIQGWLQLMKSLHNPCSIYRA